MADKPVDKVKDGTLEIAIWKNQRKSPDGHEYTTYNFTPSRMYIDKDKNPKNTTSLREADLLKMAEMFREAYTRTKDLKIMAELEKQKNGLIPEAKIIKTSNGLQQIY